MRHLEVDPVEHHARSEGLPDPLGVEEAGHPASLADVIIDDVHIAEDGAGRLIVRFGVGA